MSDFYSVLNRRLTIAPGLPVGMIPIVHARSMLSPAVLTALSLNLRAWEGLSLSPGPILPQKTYVDAEGALAFHFAPGGKPAALMPTIGLSPDVAAWLVLLDKVVGTGMMMDPARSVWSAIEVAQALPFVTPAFLPSCLVAWPPNNTERVARALAHVVAGIGEDAP